MSSHRVRLDPAVLHSGLLQPGSPWSRLEVLDVTASTNADAASLARDGAPSGTVVTADHQTAGRGRLDRTFVLPERTGVAVSVILRPEDVPIIRWGWLSLVAGLALDDLLRGLGLRGALKWPNDVLVEGRKISGISLERIESEHGAAAIIGIGLNVLLEEHELPVPTATSLLLAGASTTDRSEVLVRMLEHLANRYRDWLDPAGAEALRRSYVEACDTVGREVDVLLPDGSVLRGTATDVDEHGRLVVAGQPVSAGDVTHVRPFGHFA